MNFLKDINIFWCFWHLLRWIKANLTHSKRIQEMSPRMKLLPFESPQPHDNIKDKDTNVILSHKEWKEFLTSQKQWKALLNYKLPHYDLIFFNTFNIVGIVFIQLLQPHTIFILRYTTIVFLKLFLPNSQDTTNIPFSLFVCYVSSNQKLCMISLRNISVIVLLVLVYWDSGQSKAFSEAQMKGQIKPGFVPLSRRWLGMVQWVWWPGHCKS